MVKIEALIEKYSKIAHARLALRIDDSDGEI
jgi:hypothetical protein